LCALSTLVAAQGEIAAQDPSAKVNVLWRKAVSTDGSNQGTAYTMSNRIITARGRVFVAWLDHVADIVIQTYDLETRLWGEKVVLVPQHRAPVRPRAYRHALVALLP